MYINGKYLGLKISLEFKGIDDACSRYTYEPCNWISLSQLSELLGILNEEVVKYLKQDRLKDIEDTRRNALRQIERDKDHDAEC